MPRLQKPYPFEREVPGWDGLDKSRMRVLAGMGEGSSCEVVSSPMEPQTEKWLGRGGTVTVGTGERNTGGILEVVKLQTFRETNTNTGSRDDGHGLAANQESVASISP